VAYSTDIANLLSDQLAKLTTLNRYQLVGHVSNLDFWLAEVGHCLDVIDRYTARFNRLKSAQVQHTADHKTTWFALDDPCCINGPAELPRRVPAGELKDARRSLCDATYRLLVRCLHDGLIDEAALRQVCGGLGIGVEARDLQTRA
jgi:hypothetical protein